MFHNYKPMLSVFSKIFEKAIYTRIYSYLVKKILFLRNNLVSVVSILLTMCLSITKCIGELVDSGNYVCGIFVYLEKAFDTVNHKILCENHNYYGLYLGTRKQFVSINGFNSNLRDIVCGVPQGFTLGHLFLIEINDFRLCLDKTETSHFADDTFIMYGNTIWKHKMKYNPDICQLWAEICFKICFKIVSRMLLLLLLVLLLLLFSIIY